MSISTKFLDYIKDRTGTFACFTFDEDYLRFIYGKSSDDPISDCASLCRSAGNPFIAEIGPVTDFVPQLKTCETIIENAPEYIIKRLRMETALGPRDWILKHFKISDTNKISEATSTPVSCANDLELFKWYYDVISQNDWSTCRQTLKAKIEKLGDHGIASLFLCPPFELLYWIKREDLFLFYFDFPQQYKQAMEYVLNAYEIIINVASEVGIKIIIYGAPGGTEFTSPSIWRDAIVPTSVKLESLIAKAGLYSWFHCCGKINIIINQGYLNQIRPTILETLSPDPVGDITNLCGSRKKLDPAIITHGNLDLTFLRDANENEVIAAAKRVMEETADYPHILGAADACLLPGTNFSKIKRLCELFNPVCN